MIVLNTHVASEWVDYNGHMNDAEYARVFSQSADALLEAVGLDEAGRQRHGYTIYTLESHLCYRREAHEGQPLSVEAVVLDRDAKRLQMFFEMRDAEHNLLATSEQMLMGIDSDTGRPAPFPDAVEASIGKLPSAAPNDWPPLAGRRIGLAKQG